MRLKRRTRTTSYAVSPDFTVILGKLFKLDTLNLQDQSAFLSIHNNDSALAWRLALIENAEKTIDAQYYSWHSDISGQLLISKLIDAADRGVRVRLLLDDIHTFGADRRIATLGRHPNIEVRLFNPFRLRWPIRLVRIAEFLWNLDRLNHRMHNKLFIADNIVSIIGGRNIGDEYFGLNKNFVFRDLDLIVCGSAVNDFSLSFDLYWNSSVSKTAKRIIAFRPGRLDYQHFRKSLTKKLIEHEQIFAGILDIKTSLFSDLAHTKSLKVAPAQVFYDMPRPRSIDIGLMAESLYQCGNNTNTQLTIVSPYLVPSDNLINSLRTLIDRGINIQIYTNSLASIDVTAAFSGYQHRRRTLLSMGIEVFEFRSNPDIQSAYTTPAINVKQFGLHSKTIIYDTSTVYVGTLNLDPRSTSLNTEIGIMVEDASLAEDIRSTFQKDYSEGQFWRVRLDDKGQLYWECGTERTSVQPARGLIQRFANRIFSLLPIQHHL